MVRRIAIIIGLLVSTGILFSSTSSAINKVADLKVDVNGITASIAWNLSEKYKKPTYLIELKNLSKPELEPTVFNYKTAKATFSNLDSWTSYSVRARAIVGSKKYKWSKKSTFTITQSASDSLIVSNVNHTEASVTWDPVPGATGYNIYLNGKLTTTSQSSTHKFSGLSLGKEYTVSIAATKDNLATSISREYSFLTSESGPASLTILKVTNTSADIEWSAISGADDYEVYLDNKFLARSKSRSYSIKNLNPNNKYLVQVAARFGEKVTSKNENSFTTLSEAPKSVSLTSATTTSIALEWKGSTNFSTYNVYRDSLKVASVSSLSYTMTGLSPGSSFKVWVTGVEGEFESVASDVLLVNTLTTKPAAPVVSAITTVGATVSWTADQSAKNFIVKVYDQASNTAIKTNTVIGSTTSSIITGLSPASSYNVTLEIEYPSATTTASNATLFSTTRPTPSSARAIGVTSTAATISWDAIPGADLYELSRDEGVSSTTSSTSVSAGALLPAITLSPGVSYSVRVRAQYIDSAKIRVFSDWTTVSFTTLTDLAGRPTISTDPVITVSGPYSSLPEVVGVTLRASTGVWIATPAITSYSYQWQKSTDGGSTWGNLDNATANSYVITESDFGTKLRVAVTATNVNGSRTANSATSATVAAIYNVQAPIFRGNLVVGETLTVNAGIWYSANEINYSYQWLNAGVSISGATSNSYTLQESDVGDAISVSVTARSTLASLAVTSASRSTVAAVLNTVAPTISGVARLTEVLTATSGTWINSPSSYAYQWEQSADGSIWTAISGATLETHTVSSGQVGKYIRVAVKATKSSMSTSPVTAYSSSTSVVTAPLVITNSVAPVVSGIWADGSTLTTTTGTWSASGTYTYKWQSSSDGSTWADISGATSSTYLLTSSEASKHIRSVITITSSTGAGTAYSSRTPKVGAPYNSVAPAITGTLRVGETQTVSTGTWNITSTFTYQWQSSDDGISWINIGSATESTTAVLFTQANLSLRVVVTATNSTLTSTAISNVISGFLPPQATVIPTVTGTTTVGQTLTIATSGTWPSTSSGYAYVWQRSSDGTNWTAVSGATATTYVLEAADEGYQFRAQVSLSTNAGTSVAYSLATTAVAPS